MISTYRFEYAETNDVYLTRAKGPFIFAVWHEFGVGFLFGHGWTKPFSVLASRSKDGDFAAYISQMLGFIPVRGSSKKKNVDKGGKEAIEVIVQNLKEGISGGITVDGPKGPRRICKVGVARMAQLSGAPIIPGLGLASSFWTINSWDQFKVPKPFSTIKITYAEPIWVRPDATPEELLQACELVGKEINALISSTPS